MSAHVDVAAYAIGSLDLDDADSFEGHLDRCPTCPAELEWLSQVVRLMTAATLTEGILVDSALPEAS